MTTTRSRSVPARPARTAAKERTSVVVAADWAPIRAFDPIIRADPAAIYGDLLPVLREADLRIVNCECALTTVDKPVWKSGAVFKGAPDHVAGLSEVPFDVACLANNHVLDFGVAGLRESLAILHRHRVQTVGAGLTQEQAYAPLAVERNGLTVHVVNVSEGEDLSASRGGPGVFGWDIPWAAAVIRQCRKARGVVIAIVHCGLEYIPYPPPYVVDAFRALADAGAACVIGHHPHVPQGVEWYKGVPLVYSLGNFVFYQATDLHHRKTGMLAKVRFEGPALVGLDLHPYRITDAGLRSLDVREEAEFQRTMARLSRPLSVAGGVTKAWQAYLAYYGVQGFTAEAQGIIDRLKTEPRKAAAMFRNRLTTMQHVELWRDFLTRVMVGEPPTYSLDAYKLAQEYFTRKVQG